MSCETQSAAADPRFTKEYWVEQHRADAARMAGGKLETYAKILDAESDLSYKRWTESYKLGADWSRFKPSDIDLFALARSELGLYYNKQAFELGLNGPIAQR